MAIPLKVRIVYLLSEFLANAFELLGLGQTAGAIAILGFQTCFDALHHFFVFVQSYRHQDHLFLSRVYNISSDYARGNKRLLVLWIGA